MTNEVHEVRPAAGQPGRHRLLPIVGGGVGITALLAHLGGGAVLVHVGLPAALTYLGLGPPHLGGGALVVGLGTLGALAMMIGKQTKGTSITTGKTLHRAHSYDSHMTFLTLGRGRAWRETTIALARIEPGDAVLDVGCGTGELTLAASARTGPGGQTSGIDASPEMIAEAQRNAVRASASIDYQVAAVEHLPFPDATFNVILSSLMMHHLPDDLKDRALSEIRRALKPGGYLLVVDFRRLITLRDRLRLPFLLHPQWRNLPSGVQDLPARMRAAGFVAVEAGETDYGPVEYVRARAGLA